MVVALLLMEQIMSRLSDSQLVVLTAACQRADRCVFPVTAKLKGNAAGNVLKSLLKKDLIKEVRAKRDDTVWRHDEQDGRMTLVATKAALAALGIDPRDEAEDAEADAVEPPSANVETDPNARPKTPKTKEPKAPRTRDGSKQAQLIAMLRRAKGAMIEQIAETLGWQPHTVRGAIAGALKKKLGLTIVSEKSESRGRVYRISD
jgi:DNA-binding NarL/FixJ family response regulator